MIMATQRFQLQEPVPGLPGEWVCSGCGAPMTMDEPAGDSPAAAMVMDHADDCGEVKTLTAGRA